MDRSAAAPKVYDTSGYQETWAISRLKNLVFSAISERDFSKSELNSMLRLLYCLQEFPRIVPNINLQVDCDNCNISVSSERFAVELGAKWRLEYFRESNHLIDYLSVLEGAERRNNLENLISFFQRWLDVDSPFSIEDYSDNVSPWLDEPERSWR